MPFKILLLEINLSLEVVSLNAPRALDKACFSSYPEVFKPFKLMPFLSMNSQNATLAFKIRVLGRSLWLPQLPGFYVCLCFVCPSATLPKPSPALWLGIHALIGVLSFNFHASFIARCGDFVK